jgi:hypothetical protein
VTLLKSSKNPFATSTDIVFSPSMDVKSVSLNGGSLSVSALRTSGEAKACARATWTV